MSFCELTNVSEDGLAAENFSLFEGHVLVEVVMERGRYHIPAHFTNPLLYVLIIFWLVLCVLIVGLQDSISRLKCTLVILFFVSEVEGVLEDVLYLFKDGVGLSGGSDC